MLDRLPDEVGLSAQDTLKYADRACGSSPAFGVVGAYPFTLGTGRMVLVR